MLCTIIETDFIFLNPFAAVKSYGVFLLRVAVIVKQRGMFKGWGKVDAR